MTPGFKGWTIYIWEERTSVVNKSEAEGLLLVNFSRSGQVHCEVAIASWQRCLAKQAFSTPMDADPSHGFWGVGKKTMSKEGP